MVPCLCPIVFISDKYLISSSVLPPTPGLTFMDLTINVPPEMSVRDSHQVESFVRETVMKARREVRELKIHVHALEDGEKPAGEKNGSKSDFGRDGC